MSVVWRICCTASLILVVKTELKASDIQDHVLSNQEGPKVSKFYLLALLSVTRENCFNF